MKNRISPILSGCPLCHEWSNKIWLHRNIGDLLLSLLYLTNFFQNAVVNPNIGFRTKDKDTNYLTDWLWCQLRNGNLTFMTVGNEELRKRIPKAAFQEIRLIKTDITFGTIPWTMVDLRENYFDLPWNIAKRPHLVNGFLRETARVDVAGVVTCKVFWTYFVIRLSARNSLSLSSFSRFSRARNFGHPFLST